MNRRSAARLILLSAASLPAAGADAATNGQQGEYLYFLPERDRVQAAAAAQALLAEFDATVPMDVRRLAGVYQRASPALRRQRSESAFVERVTGYRAGLGARRERVLQGVEGGFRFLPNLPDGQYAIVVFDTLFGAPAATPSIHTEQFTLGRDAARGSAWELVDYYLDLKPFYKY